MLRVLHGLVLFALLANAFPVAQATTHEITSPQVFCLEGVCSATLASVCSAPSTHMVAWSVDPSGGNVRVTLRFQDAKMGIHCVWDARSFEAHRYVLVELAGASTVLTFVLRDGPPASPTEAPSVPSVCAFLRDASWTSRAFSCASTSWPDANGWVLDVPMQADVALLDGTTGAYDLAGQPLTLSGFAYTGSASAPGVEGIQPPFFVVNEGWFQSAPRIDLGTF